MFAWGFSSGFAHGRHSVPQAADLCLAKYGPGSWGALELDDGNFGPYNVSIYDEFVYHWNLRGMKAGPWFTEGGNLYKTPGNSDFAIAEVEGPGDLEGVTNICNGVGGGPLPDCSLAICTNFFTLTRENTKVLRDHGFVCLTEAYMNELATLTPDRMDQVARYLGWPNSQPVFGVYPTASDPDPDYSQWEDWPGVDYLAEFVI